MADKRRQRRDFCHLHNRERRINECWVLSNHWKYRMVPPQWCLLVYKPHYPLVMTNITMERSTMLLMGKSTISIGSFSIANCWHHQRVTDEATQKVSWFASRMAASRNIVVFFYHGWTNKFIDDGWSTHNLHFFDGKNPFLVGYLICSMVMSNKANTLNHPLIFFGSTFDMLSMGQWVTRPIHCPRSQWYQPQGSWIWCNYPMITSE